MNIEYTIQTVNDFFLTAKGKSKTNDIHRIIDPVVASIQEKCKVSQKENIKVKPTIMLKKRGLKTKSKWRITTNLNNLFTALN